jgi:hypothetical protein
VKIAIIRGMEFSSYDDYYSTTFIPNHITQWLEVDEETYKALQLWVQDQSRSDVQYRLIQDCTEQIDINNIVASAKEVWKLRAVEEAARKARTAAAARARNEKARERKLKQLEKLKKELGQ